MTIPTLLDHVVIAGPDLADLVEWFADRTGVVAAPGGAHPTGTANALVALTVDGRRGPQYVELIGPDPARAEAALPRTFGIDALSVPVVQAYAVHPHDIDATVATARAAGYDPGDVQPLSRRTPAGTLLEWRLTRGEHQRLDVPFLIDWGTTPQPGVSDIPSIELVSFVRTEPDPEPLRATSSALGLGDGVAEVRSGEASAFHLTVRTADGALVTL
ncbi:MULTISPECIES: VOC family protein [Microbacterium]|uniref:VOC family protein n=1 Tax=Microbacterium TaxID=33882 RepID=UPI0027898940|nr:MULTISPECIES: VOC family protein [Microbacterium]MDQ1082101.1 catechol 2,3-dioxygenase-like lactoylglutathione lyase family enzyme [Microbacterium sp. SORGH_AS_0344]MDQ1169132.1 catechol 2,3-dioxygenase-like lactoylglutathione lyase family enzyme [Microbacterium proteolyticum]